jgi:hypothetical protein
MRKTPLPEVFHFFPGNGARKLDGGMVMMKPENLIAFDGAKKLVGL